MYKYVGWYSVHKKTVNFIESIGNTKVIALVLYPIQYDTSSHISRYHAVTVTNDELNKKIKEISSETYIPVYTNSKEDVQYLYKNIIDFFNFGL